MNYREIVSANRAPNAISDLVTKNVHALKLAGQAMSQYGEVFNRAGVNYSKTRRESGVYLWDNHRFATTVIGLVNIISNDSEVARLNRDPDKNVNDLPNKIMNRSKEEWEEKKTTYEDQVVFPHVVYSPFDRISWAGEFLNWFTKYIAPVNSVVEVGSAADALLLGMKERKKEKLQQLIGIDRLSVQEALNEDSMQILVQSLQEKRKLDKAKYLERLKTSRIEHYVASAFDLKPIVGQIESVKPRLVMFNHILEYFPKVSIKNAIEQVVEYLRPNYIVIRNGLEIHGLRDKVSPNGIYLHKVKY